MKKILSYGLKKRDLQKGKKRVEKEVFVSVLNGFNLKRSIFCRALKTYRFDMFTLVCC